MPTFFLFTKIVHVHFRKEKGESKISSLPYPVPLLIDDLFQTLLSLSLVMITVSFLSSFVDLQALEYMSFHCEKMRTFAYDSLTYLPV